MPWWNNNWLNEKKKTIRGDDTLGGRNLAMSEKAFQIFGREMAVYNTSEHTPDLRMKFIVVP